jgi:translation initiation factor 1
MENRDSNSRLIFSTSRGRICPECAQAYEQCACADLKKEVLPDTDGIVRLCYEHTGRGKGVTSISGVVLSQKELLALAKKLKQKFGTGGTVEGFTILLQGDFCRQASGELRKRGFNVK